MTLSMTSRSSDSHVKKEDENIWMDILTQVQEKHSKSQLCRKQIILIGDKDCGKSNLISKISGLSESASEARLEYRIINLPFHDMEDEFSRNIIGAWLVDPFTEEKLLKFAINENTFPDTTFIILASMSHPQTIISSLKQSINMLKDFLESNMKEKMKEHSKKVLSNKNNVEFDASEILNDFLSKPPLSILGCNLIVAITNSDCANSSTLFGNDFQKQDLYLNYISTEIRKLCLEYGAALIYLSVKNEKNIDIFLKYVFHLMFSHTFEQPTLILERDALFIPAGCDTLKKIEICTPNNIDLSIYEDEFTQKGPSRKPVSHEKNDAYVSAEPDDEFLNKLLNMMNKEIPSLGGTTGGRPGQDMPLRNPVGVQKLSDRRISGSHTGMQPPSPHNHTPKKSDAKAGSHTVVAGEGVLQSFFNSLLNRRTGSPASPLATSARNPSDKAAIRHEAVADFAEKKIKKDMHPQREAYPHTTHTDSDEDK